MLDYMAAALCVCVSICFISDNTGFSEIVNLQTTDQNYNQRSRPGLCTRGGARER